MKNGSNVEWLRRHAAAFDKADDARLSECADELEAALLKLDRLETELEDAKDKADRFDRAEVWAGKVEVENSELRSRLDSIHSWVDNCGDALSDEAGHRLYELLDAVVERQS